MLLASHVRFSYVNVLDLVLLFLIFFHKHLFLLRKNEDSKTIMNTVIPGNATGEEGRANQLDVAKRSYLDALTRGRE